MYGLGNVQGLGKGSKQVKEVTEGRQLLNPPRRAKCPSCGKYRVERVSEGVDGFYYKCKECGEIFYIQTKDTKVYRKFRVYFPEKEGISWDKVEKFIRYYDRLVPGLVKYDNNKKCILYRKRLEKNEKWGFVEVRADNKVIVRLRAEEIGDTKP